MDELKHNDRFDIVYVMFTVNNKVMQTVTIRNAIIWRMDIDTIDVAQFGHNISNMILMIDRTTIYDDGYDYGDNRLRLKVKLD